MNKFRDVAFGLLCLVLLVGVLWYGYEKYQDNKIETSSDLQETESVVIPTLDQRINDWNTEKHENELYELCFQLPEQTVKAILNKIGTTASYESIAEEYLRNTNYYISLQVKENMQGIIGPDANNASIEIKTNIKKEDSIKPVKVPVIIQDSIIQ